jgi:hypothetical protein
LALTRYLADADLKPPPDAGDSVFFTVGRWIVVRYPTVWSVLMSLTALLIFVVAVFRGITPARLFKGVGIALGAFVTALFAGALIWMLITTVRTTPGIWESYLYLALLLTVTGGLWRLLAGRIEPDTALFGVVGVWLLLALTTSLLAPGTSYLFTWPALVGSLFVLAKSLAPVWSLLVVSLITLTVTVPIIDFLFQMAQPRPGNPDSQLIPVAGLVAALAVLVIALIDSMWKTTNTQPQMATR